MPVGFRLLLPKGPRASHSANARFREMVGALGPPHGAQRVLVGGDAADGSKANRRMVPERDPADPPRPGRFVLAIPRTGKTVEDKPRHTLVSHVPRQDAPRPPVPRETAGKGRRTFGTSHPRVGGRHVGDVPLGLSKKGRNVGPHPTQLLVPHRTAWTPSHGVGLYQKRWAVALRHWERQAGRGLGEPPVRGDTHRSEKSVGIAGLASLFVRRVCHHAMVPGQPWHIFPWQQALRLRAMTHHVEHKVKRKMAKTRQAA